MAHRNSWFIHWTWWLSIVVLVYRRLVDFILWIMMKTVKLWWIVAFQCQQMLETSRKFSDLFIPFYPTVYSMLEWAWKGQLYEARQNTLCTFRWIYPSCRHLSNCQNMPEISAPCPQMDFTRFPGWKTHPKWVRYEANSGAAKLDSEAGRGAGADRFISGVKGEVSAELSDFRCVFLTNLRPFKYVEQT